MREKKTTFIKRCDICGKEAFSTCLCCGKDFCITHEKNGSEYLHSVDFGGSGDGFFCKECDIELGTYPLATYSLASKPSASFKPP